MPRYVAFCSNFACRLLLDLDSYSVNDPDRMFPLFYKQGAWELAPKLAVILDTELEGVVYEM